MRIGLNAQVMSTGAGFRNAGVSRYTTAIVERLAGDAEFEFVLYVNDSVRELPFPVPAGMQVRRSALPTSRTAVRVLWEQTAMPWRAVRDRLDVTHSFLNVSPILAPGGQVLTIHDLSYIVEPTAHPWRRRLYLNAMSRLSARRARVILADSRATRRDIVEHFHVDPSKIWVVYAAADPDMLPLERGLVEDFRGSKGLPDDYVLYLGTLEPRKNIDVLVRAFGKLRRSGYSGQLVLAGGKGWGYAAIEAAVEDEGLAEVIHFAGYVPREEQPLWYNSAQVFVYPSAYEGFGLPVLEAMACGTPVITTTSSSLPEVVGDAGLLTTPGDVDELASVLIELVASNEQHETMRDAGLARATRFSWDVAVQKCRDAYRLASGPS